MSSDWINRFMAIHEGGLDTPTLARLAEPPPLFAPGALPFWDDQHISEQMLRAHLDPESDAASRRPAAIDASVQWLVQRLDLRPGDRVLDLGCGPGLYCLRLAMRGLDVTGVDYSRRSIDHARAAAAEAGIAIDYRLQDYLTLETADSHVTVLLIYGDLCVLPDAQRDELLGRVRRALVPGGHFVFDVSTPAARLDRPAGTRWAVCDGGFWRPDPYFLLERVFDYVQDGVRLDQYAVIERSGECAVYRLWVRYYTPAGITSVLERQQFVVDGVYGDLAGTEYTPESRWLGVVARKRG